MPERRSHHGPKKNRPESTPAPGTRKFTPATRKAIAENLAIGMSYDTAGALVGISRETIRVWLQDHADFALEVATARAQRVRYCHRAMLNLVDGGHFAATRWMLEQIAPADYSPRSLRIDVPSGAPDAAASGDDPERMTVTLSVPFVPGREIRNDPAKLSEVDDLLLADAEARRADARGD